MKKGFKPCENGSKYRTFKENAHNVIKAKSISASQPTAFEEMYNISKIKDL